MPLLIRSFVLLPRRFAHDEFGRSSVAAKGELMCRGFEERTSGDLHVVAYLGVRPEVDRAWEHSRGIRGRKNIASEGASIVDVVDPTSGRPIWRERATAMLEKGNSPETKSRRMARVAQKLFADFPPR
jgi:hypothetical protein